MAIIIKKMSDPQIPMFMPKWCSFSEYPLDAQPDMGEDGWVGLMIEEWLASNPYYPVEQTLPHKDMRWLGISAWQKAIRRGYPKAAQALASALLSTPEIDASYMWNRLSIIGMEDIGVADIYGNIALQWLKNKSAWRKKIGDTKLLQLMSIRLANAPKDRNSCDLMVGYKYDPDMVGERHDLCNTDPDTLKSIAADNDQPVLLRGLALHVLNGTYTHQVPTMMTVGGNVAQVNEVYVAMKVPEAVRYIVKRGANGQREGHHINLGLIWSLSRKAAVEPEEGLINLGFVHDFFHSAAFDKHTREGKKSLGYWKKANPTVREICNDDLELLGSMVFRVEGHQVNKRLVYPLSKEIVKHAETSFLHYKAGHDCSTLLPHLLDIYDEVHPIRVKIHQREMEQLK